MLILGMVLFTSGLVLKFTWMVSELKDLMKENDHNCLGDTFRILKQYKMYRLRDLVWILLLGAGVFIMISA